MTGAEAEDAADLAEEYPSPSVTNAWDAGGRAMKLFQQTLSLPIPAWDVYLLYPPGVRWPTSPADAPLAPPPAPAYWMHQLGEPNTPRVEGRWLDPAELSKRLHAL